MNMAFNPLDILKKIGGVTGTQQDVHTISQTAEQFQSPGVQAKLKEIETQAQIYLATQLTLQLVATVAIVGTFFLNLKKSNGSSRRRSRNSRRSRRR